MLFSLYFSVSKNVTMRARNVVITFVAIADYGWLPKDFFTAFIPSMLGIIVYNDFTSSDASRSCLG